MTYINTKLEANFDSLQELEYTVKQFNKNLNETQYRVLNVLKQHSLKVLGISYLKQATIAKKLNLSIITINRTISFLKKNGYITAIQNFRKKMGGKGANYYQINDVKTQQKIQNDVSQMMYREDPKKTPEKASNQGFGEVQAKKETIYLLKLLNNLSNKNTVIKIKKILDFNEHIKNINVSDDVYKFASNYFEDDYIVYVYKKLRQRLRNDDIDVQYHDEIIIKVLKILVKNIKQSNNKKRSQIKNLHAYILGVYDNFIAENKFVYTNNFVSEFDDFRHQIFSNNLACTH